mgnify:CR=1 FL=1
MNGAKIQQMRKERGLTRRAVAMATGLTEQTIRVIEVSPECNPTIKTLQAIADFYGVPVAELIAGEN